MQRLQIRMPTAAGACSMSETSASTALVSPGMRWHRLPEQLGRRPPTQCQWCWPRATPARCRYRPSRCQASDDSQQHSATTSPASSEDRIRQTISGLDLLLGIDEEAEKKKQAEARHSASLTAWWTSCASVTDVPHLLYPSH